MMPVPDTAPNLGSQDVEMESDGSPDRDPDLPGWEYDPDDRQEPDRAAVASAKAGSGRIINDSASSDFGQQATDAEKCLTFADLLSGPARNWYRQLAWSTRKKWPDLLKSFQIQYCGFGISVARQYYHARKRSDDSPLEYLHRLNVAGIRAQLKIKDGGSKERQVHVDHFIETLGDQELSNRLTLLRLPDTDELEEVLRALERARTRQKSVRIQAASSESDSGSDGSDESDSDEDHHRQIFLAAVGDQADRPTKEPNREPIFSLQPDQAPHDHRSKNPADGPDSSRYTDCGSRKHTDLGCWRRLTCQKCGKRDHAGDHCVFVCRGRGELHDMGKCPMEEFYNQIRQWFDPNTHAGMLPAMAENMLN
ncbi:unnamed protein product [Phytophthora fragariaefolia]|uniref:Unnamed protein product n=1 Tax=Phytophthora fragariaefolia TaxID=1490495 RepID=A0A9W6YQ57_9STRA|nr:unnamed protein product [Phytophthora fragariaefolia]